jgi:hypothetical protein
MGIIFGSVFEMSDGSVWPCILLNAEFSASASGYYATAVHVNRVGTYVAELVAVGVAASILFWIATRNRRSATVPAYLTA